MRILMSATGSNYAYEGHRLGKERIVFDSHKILTAYGHHQCDGLSFVMVPLWRAAGYIAYDEASHSHTTASLFYKDHDGQQRFHSYDLKKGFFWWNPSLGIVGARTQPLMQGTVFRHLTQPQKVHNLRTSLHLNETIERKWQNTGHVIPYGKQSAAVKFNKYYKYHAGRTDGVYSTAGVEVQTFTPNLTKNNFEKDLNHLSKNIRHLTGKGGNDLLTPANTKQSAQAVYKIASPYPAVAGRLQIKYHLTNTKDRFKLFLSREGDIWELIHNGKHPGDHNVELELGKKRRSKGKLSVYTAYTFFLKMEMNAFESVSDVRLEKLLVTVHRNLNKRTLPNLMPGENIFKVNADAIYPGKALDLSISYKLKGKPFEQTHMIKTFPYYFRINVKDAEPEIRKNYDRVFSKGDLQMRAIKIKLVDNVPLEKKSKISIIKGERLFKKAYPHPSGSLLLKKRNRQPKKEDGSKLDGFFPQIANKNPIDSDTQNSISQLIEILNNGKDSSPKTWKAAEKLGNYPSSIDVLLKRLPKANGDLTIFICKALSLIRSPKAIDPLLEKWQKIPKDAPGTRYIPDVFAAIGDRKVVPHLIDKLKTVRFDYRLHIAHALGTLGGKEAEAALYELSIKDPFPAVRRLSSDALANLRSNPT